MHQFDIVTAVNGGVAAQQQQQQQCCTLVATAAHLFLKQSTPFTCCKDAVPAGQNGVPASASRHQQARYALGNNHLGLKQLLLAERPHSPLYAYAAVAIKGQQAALQEVLVADSNWLCLLPVPCLLCRIVHLNVNCLASPQAIASADRCLLPPLTHHEGSRPGSVQSLFGSDVHPLSTAKGLLKHQESAGTALHVPILFIQPFDMLGAKAEKDGPLKPWSTTPATERAFPGGAWAAHGCRSGQRAMPAHRHSMKNSCACVSLADSDRLTVWEEQTRQ